MSIYETTIKNPKKIAEFYRQLCEQKDIEIEQLKQKLEECQLQNCNLREDIIIKKMSFQNEEIKDKSLLELYNMPSYEDLKNENQQLKSQLEQKDDIINKVSNYIDKFIPIDEDTILMRIRQRDYIIELLNTDKGDA